MILEGSWSYLSDVDIQLHPERVWFGIPFSFISHRVLWENNIRVTVLRCAIGLIPLSDGHDEIIGGKHKVVGSA